MDFEKFVSRPLGKIEPVIVNILRLGIYQIVFMDRIPASAVCNEAVNLAKQFSNPGSAKFVNGVLRNLIRQPENTPCRPAIKPLKFLYANSTHSGS